MKMAFGRFRGMNVADLPDEYLAWLDGLGDLREPLRSAVKAERVSRASVPASGDLRDVARQVIDAGQRLLGLHGDRPLRVHARQAASWLHGLIRSEPTAPRADRVEADDETEIARRAETAEALMASWRRQDRPR